MYTVGREEIDALAKVIKSGALFRYGLGSECDRFEERYARYLGAKHFALAASGSNALVAAMIGLGLGPGDEVLIPAHTYMATATSVGAGLLGFRNTRGVSTNGWSFGAPAVVSRKIWIDVSVAVSPNGGVTFSSVTVVVSVTVIASGSSESQPVASDSRRS